jgi:cytosine/adenosine deaminase-related metal-dependent hydrolase
MLRSISPLQNGFLLRGGRVAVNSVTAARFDVLIGDGKIRSLCPSGTDTSDRVVLNLEGMLILPGLINSHDHLEFGLFPRLGKGPYPDARSWALDIHQPQRSPIRELSQITKATRLFWGGLKNLLSGVTTVCHHNQYDAEVFEADFPVRVVRRYGWCHSFDFGGDMQRQFADTPPHAPFVIHLAEGTTTESCDEIYRLDRMGLLTSRTVLVHGVALDTRAWDLVRRRAAGIIWCPSSNLFMLGKTLDCSLFDDSIRAALGNDSPLTADGDLLDEIRCAQRLGVSPEQAYDMVGKQAASLLRLCQGEGEIREGGVADLLVVSDSGEAPAVQVASLRAEMIQSVIVAANLQLVSADLANRFPPFLYDGMIGLKCNEMHCLVRAKARQHWELVSQVLGDEWLLTGKLIRLE